MVRFFSIHSSKVLENTQLSNLGFHCFRGSGMLKISNIVASSNAAIPGFKAVDYVTVRITNLLNNSLLH